MPIIKKVSSAVLIATQLSACTTSPVPMVSEAQRSRLGTVGVVSLTSAPRGDLAVGARGRSAAAAEGAAVGAAVGTAAFFMSAHASSCAGMGGAVCIVLLPIVAVGGAISGATVGAAQAVPKEKAEEIETRLKTVLAEVGQQERLRSAVVKAAAASGMSRVNEMARAVGEVVDYRKLVRVDTVLEVGVESVGLLGRGGADPALALHVNAVARLVDARTGAELYRGRAFTHATGPRKFTEWSAADARLLKEELDRAYQSLGRSIVDEIFLVVRTN